LYDAFLPEYYWTEVMECLRKLLLTGFVVFFYEGSGLQIFASMIISMIFFAFFNNVKPYLMPSNNTFAIFVHFQVTFTLACTLLLRMNENFNSNGTGNMNIDSTSLSYALLISNVSVLVIGVILILRACFNTSEGDFLDAGFDDEIQEIRSGDLKEQDSSNKQDEMLSDNSKTTNWNEEEHDQPFKVEKVETKNDEGEDIKMIPTSFYSSENKNINNFSTSSKTPKKTKKKRVKKKKITKKREWRRIGYLKSEMRKDDHGMEIYHLTHIKEQN